MSEITIDIWHFAKKGDDRSSLGEVITGSDLIPLELEAFAIAKKSDAEEIKIYSVNDVIIAENVNGQTTFKRVSATL